VDGGSWHWLQRSTDDVVLLFVVDHYTYVHFLSFIIDISTKRFVILNGRLSTKLQIKICNLQYAAINRRNCIRNSKISNVYTKCTWSIVEAMGCCNTFVKLDSLVCLVWYVVFWSTLHEHLLFFCTHDSLWF